MQRKVDKAMTENVDLKGNHSFFFSFVSSFSFVLAIERYRECAKDKYQNIPNEKKPAILLVDN